MQQQRGNNSTHGYHPPLPPPWVIAVISPGISPGMILAATTAVLRVLVVLVLVLLLPPRRLTAVGVEVGVAVEAAAAGVALVVVAPVVAV